MIRKQEKIKTQFIFIYKKKIRIGIKEVLPKSMSRLLTCQSKKLYNLRKSRECVNLLKIQGITHT